MPCEDCSVVVGMPVGFAQGVLAYAILLCDPDPMMLPPVKNEIVKNDTAMCNTSVRICVAT